MPASFDVISKFLEFYSVPQGYFSKLNGIMYDKLISSSPYDKQYNLLNIEANFETLSIVHGKRTFYIENLGVYNDMHESNT